MTCGVTQPHGLGFGVPATPAFVLGVSAGLRSRAEPGRVLVAHWKHDELPAFCPDSYGELSYYARQATTTDGAAVDAGMRVCQQAELFSLYICDTQLRSWLS